MFCLNMIVRNESARIERCLKSAQPYISQIAIVDTGSTDDTKDIIKRFAETNNLTCFIKDIPFENFEQARNAALEFGRTVGSEDYLLLMDADMELVVTDQNAFSNLMGPSYDMVQKAGGLMYNNRRLLRRDTTGGYVGVTHEYLDVPASGLISGAFFVDHADGSNRKDKFKRDIALLKPEAEKYPERSRNWFYLGQSYRDAGDLDLAAEAYAKCVELNGWNEEVWNAQHNVAECMAGLGDEAEFIRNALLAYNLRPTRAETLFLLAKHFRIKGENFTSLLFSEAGMKLPLSKDSLFVSEYPYVTGLKEEFSICAFYDEKKRKEGYAVCNELALDKKGDNASRNQARNNLYFYLNKLKEFAPSFKEKKIDFTPSDDKTFEPTGYNLLNPSVACHGSQLWCIIRTVNYRIDGEGRYIIKAIDGTANDSNPINTRNYLARLNKDLGIETVSKIKTQTPDPAFKLVIGFEDMRLYDYKGTLWSSSCVREFTPEGWCEQVSAPIFEENKGYVLGPYKRMIKEPRQTEKNWMPIVGTPHFMYRLGEAVDVEGKTVFKKDTSYDCGHISGGSQVIPFIYGYLAVVHEAAYRDGRRYYQHRFAYFNMDYSLRSLSLPFVFQDKQIEFAAGLARHPDGKNLILSYGIRDCEAWLGTISEKDVRAMEFLW